MGPVNRNCNSSTVIKQWILDDETGRCTGTCAHRYVPAAVKELGNSDLLVERLCWINTVGSTDSNNTLCVCVLNVLNAAMC